MMRNGGVGVLVSFFLRTSGPGCKSFADPLWSMCEDSREKFQVFRRDVGDTFPPSSDVLRDKMVGMMFQDAVRSLDEFVAGGFVKWQVG